MGSVSIQGIMTPGRQNHATLARSIPHFTSACQTLQDRWKTNLGGEVNYSM